MRRVLDLCISIPVSLCLALPLLGAFAIRKMLTGKVVLKSQNIMGGNGEEITVFRFNRCRAPFDSLALFFSVITGKLHVVGVSMKDPGEQKTPLTQETISDKPGIFSLWSLRQASKIGHEGREATDQEYIKTRTLVSDLLIILRTIPATLFQTSTDYQFQRSLTLLDIDFENIGMDEAVELVRQAAFGVKRTKSFFFVNPDCFNKAHFDSDYRSVLQKGDSVFPDGIGVNIGCKLLGTPLKENVNGTDMLPFLCEMAKENDYSLFLLGGKPGVGEVMAETITRKFGVEVSGIHHGYFDHQNSSEEIIALINRSNASILLVAFGAPLQEKWISTYQDQLKPGAALGVGGLFDFYSGNIKRAPRWLREIGLEWSYRLLQEPGRMWRRYIIGNPLFLFRVLAWKRSLSSTEQS